jgi:hypothetical protein
MEAAMPYRAAWLVPGRIITLKLLNPFTLQDFHRLHQVISQDYLPDASPPCIHALFDISGVEALPFGINDVLATLYKMPADPDIRRKFGGWRVYYGQNHLGLRQITSALHEALGEHYVWLPDEETALKFLMLADDTLPNLLIPTPDLAH